MKTRTDCTQNQTLTYAYVSADTTVFKNKKNKKKIIKKEGEREGKEGSKQERKRKQSNSNNETEEETIKRPLLFVTNSKLSKRPNTLKNKNKNEAKQTTQMF